MLHLFCSISFFATAYRVELGNKTYCLMLRSGSEVQSRSFPNLGWKKIQSIHNLIKHICIIRITAFQPTVEFSSSEMTTTEECCGILFMKLREINWRSSLYNRCPLVDITSRMSLKITFGLRYQKSAAALCWSICGNIGIWWEISANNFFFNNQSIFDHSLSSGEKKLPAHGVKTTVIETSQ